MGRRYFVIVTADIVYVHVIICRHQCTAFLSNAALICNARTSVS